MKNTEIQIISFNNPFPPNYGGMIEVFYKIKALYELGIKVHLHFFFDERDDISNIKKYCKTVYFYKRNASLLRQFSILPFAVNSRVSKEIYKNLNISNAPILFESLRTCHILLNYSFKQKTAVRCHNIEHLYMQGLYRSEKKLYKKIAYFFEAFKFKKFESILNKVDNIFSLSNYETKYFSENYDAKTTFVPVFQPYTSFSCKNGFGKYALYHGDLRVSDNVKSAFFLIEIFNGLSYPLIIASSYKLPSLINKIRRIENVSFIEIQDNNDLDKIINEAHINTLYSFQRSGTKLKVLSSLFKGRHCILNENMIDDNSVLGICEIASNKKEYQKKVNMLFSKKFTLTEERKQSLNRYENKLNAQKIINALLN